MLEFIEKLPKAKQRWVRSFLIANLLFWAVPAAACFTSAGECGEAFMAYPMMIYAPYWFWRLPFPTFTLGNFLDGITMVASGLAAHYLLALYLGRRFKSWVPAWYVSVPCAVGIILVGTIGSMKLMTILGFLI